MTTNTTSNLTAADIKRGETYRVVADLSGHDFPIGSLVKSTNGRDGFKQVDESAEPKGTWFAQPQEVERVAPPRPLIDFSTDRRATVRGYASDLVSRVHQDHTNEVLRRIAAGEEVDAYEIATVLPDVFSVCATRAGQSMGRREWTKKARALSHIVIPTLLNHADGLPAYEQGDRSRKIETLEGEVAALKTAGAAALAEVDALTATLEERTVDADLFTFALGLLSETERARVEGFRAGLAAR